MQATYETKLTPSCRDLASSASKEVKILTVESIPYKKVVPAKEILQGQY